ncbi:ribosome-recycling factor, mitochondrial isoform X2 [Corvus cornix cornix]|uniref:ribosome-recycling factor, mitochondrial isoform X2 n=1 Tax=Corvus cornix cornix TaxID=932674 RepID=UPI00053538B6|nr:ribosome-recycling factor, mitochondrial isoform X2 [Corvus cornix cornix]
MALALRCLRPLPSLLHRSSFAMTRWLPQAPRGCPACVQQMLLSRQLATKKAKGKGQSQAKVNISAALVEDIINLEETSEDMQAVIEALKEDFSRSLSVRTSPGALDHITVMTKDGKFPLNQLGQISQKSPQLMIVNMTDFPESTAAAVKAIRESGMNLNPEVDGTMIRVPIPKKFLVLEVQKLLLPREVSCVEPSWVISSLRVCSATRRGGTWRAAVLKPLELGEAEKKMFLVVWCVL